MHDISLILLIAYGLTFALFLGAITNRIGLSPIVGYLLAGIVIGPYTPGFEGDEKIAAQLAEIGVILLMFGVGLHFHLEDLLRVRYIALPGAVFQVSAAIALTVGVVMGFSYDLGFGLILGTAISVASTVVLIRALVDNQILHTKQGHIAVGWLIVEDIFTIVALVLLPVLQGAIDAGNISAIFLSFGEVLVKIGALTVLVLVVGKKILPKLMNYMARTRSSELFTLAVLVAALGVATGSSELLGVSMALGAFLAGMVVGQSDVSHQATSNLLPMKDVFTVLFFVSIGMLFNPYATVEHAGLIASILGVIIIGKPLAAIVIVLLFGYPLKTALVISVALAQIGEFSFILGQVAKEHGFLPDFATSVLVTCAIVSITLNPLLFKLIDPFERWILSKPFLAKFLPKQEKDLADVEIEDGSSPRAIVVGYGPVGQTLTRILMESDIEPLIIDMNVDTVRRLRSKGKKAIYGDASSVEILTSAGIKNAEFILVTLPHEIRYEIVATALSLNPDIKIILRAHYLSEQNNLTQSSISAVVYEELEAAVALADTLLKEMGVEEDTVKEKVEAIRNELTAPRTAA